jgi:hypothetical protein
MSIKEILSLRKQRLSLQRDADLLEQQEKKLTNDLVNYMVGKKLDDFTEGEDQVVLVTSTEPLVNSWPDLLDYIRENDALDIFQKRLTASAVKARWTDGLEIPGVDRAVKHSIKFNV